MKLTPSCMSPTPAALAISSSVMTGVFIRRTASVNSRKARWYWAPPKSRWCALPTSSSMMRSHRSAGTSLASRKEPPRSCSVSSVSPYWAGEAWMVPWMTEPSERRKNSRKWLAVFFRKSMDSASSSWFVWPSFISADRSSPCGGERERDAGRKHKSASNSFTRA